MHELKRNSGDECHPFAFHWRKMLFPYNGLVMIRMVKFPVKMSLVSFTISMASLGLAQSWGSVQIDATDNLSGAGNASNPTPNPGGGSGGTAASGYTLQAGAGRQLKFSSVSGIVSMSANVVHSNPDGVDPITGLPPFGIGMKVSSYDGISGVSLDKGSGFLAGVFLGSSYPGSAPPDLAFFNGNGSNGISTSFTSLAP